MHPAPFALARLRTALGNGAPASELAMSAAGNDPTRPTTARRLTDTRNRLPESVFCVATRAHGAHPETPPRGSVIRKR